MRYSIGKVKKRERGQCDGYCSGNCDNPDCESKLITPRAAATIHECSFCGCMAKTWKSCPAACWSCDCCGAQWYQDGTEGPKQLCKNPKPYVREYGRGDDRWALNSCQFTPADWNKICDSHGAEFQFAEYDSQEDALRALEKIR